MASTTRQGHIRLNSREVNIIKRKIREKYENYGELVEDLRKNYKEIRNTSISSNHVSNYLSTLPTARSISPALAIGLYETLGRGRKLSFLNIEGKNSGNKKMKREYNCPVEMGYKLISQGQTMLLRGTLEILDEKRNIINDLEALLRKYR